jgi:SAM-dependent methyltransferase
MNTENKISRHFDFIEIGTSDFWTLIEESNEDTVGISIEPIGYYLDRLPDKPNVIKLKSAVSSSDGECDVYYIEDSKIQENSLQWWVRGSNSINGPHPIVLKDIGEELYNKLVTIEKVPTISWKTLIRSYDIGSIGHLKIDTEGHDHVILKDFLEYCNENSFNLPNKITLEYFDDISNKPEIDKLIESLDGFNVEINIPDMILTRKGEKFYNIEEQRLWNLDSNWEVDGHEWSKSFGTTEDLWNNQIFDKIKDFRGKKILEIAPGFGRITQFLSILAGELIVVDLNPLCIEKTRNKLKHHVLAYFVNDGKSIPKVRNNSQDLVFSFDSFVHMHANVTEEYIKEIYRVLKPGGQAFIHHSWFYGGSDNSTENIAGRANMNPERFKEIVSENGMEIISQDIIRFEPLDLWNGTDCISTFRKPI